MGAPRVRALGGAALAASLAACTHDFSVFEPKGDPSAQTPTPDAAAPSDAGALADAGPFDAGKPPSFDAASLGDGATSCGSDCRIEALSCAGTCAEIEQSCAAPCGTDAGCAQGCLSSETQCTGQCVTQCETCTSGEGCIDPAGCAAAAP